MPTITSAETFWNANAALDSSDEARCRSAMAALIGLAVHDPSKAGARAADVLLKRFGIATVTEARG
ncbi:MAG: hypothetical protein ING29_15830 [Azospirillum sp.]|nr:hypothetical protein [Azospirillum sp.]